MATHLARERRRTYFSTHARLPMLRILPFAANAQWLSPPGPAHACGFAAPAAFASPLVCQRFSASAAGKPAPAARRPPSPFRLWAGRLSACFAAPPSTEQRTAATRPNKHRQRNSNRKAIA